MIIAALALGGAFLAAYLTLYHYGYVGSLACGGGGCESVQTSKYANFIGLPVGFGGLVYYVTVFALATWGAMGAAEKLWPTKILLAFNGWSVLFSGYLTWAEIAKINLICRYCVASALIVLVLFVFSVLDWRARTRPVVGSA
jgi:uncharacterized membrane protein